MLKSLVGRHTHANLRPLIDPLEGRKGHVAVKQAESGTEVLERELLPVEVHGELLLLATGHGLDDAVRALGVQVDGVLIKPFYPEPGEVQPEGDLGVVTPLGL